MASPIRELSLAPLFTWEGRDLLGNRRQGQLRSEGQWMVHATLRRQGIVATVVRRQRRLGIPRRPQRRELAVFTRQLATLIRAGIAQLQALQTIQRGLGRSVLADALEQVGSEVAAGQPLSQAMGRHPALFRPLYCHLVAIGEQSGTMEEMLERLALQEEKSLAMSQRLRSAMVYPAAVMTVAVAAVALILIVVVPAFEGVFASFGAELPGPTQIVIGASGFLLTWGWLLGAVSAGLGLGLRLWLKRSPKARAALEALWLGAPLLGEALRKALLARWARMMGTLLGAGLPLLEALRSVSQAMDHETYHRVTVEMAQEVGAGQALSLAMEGSGAFSPMLVQMAAIGEESGALDEMMAKAAQMLEFEVDEAAKGLASLLEPATIAVIGMLIGGIILAMYLPIFRLGSLV